MQFFGCNGFRGHYECVVDCADDVRFGDWRQSGETRPGGLE